MRAHPPAMTSIEELASDQRGVLSRDQVVPELMSKHAWSWRLERGVWQRVLPGVVVTHSGGVTQEQRLWAAVLHAGKDAALSGRSALSALGMRLGREGEQEDVDVVVPLRRTPSSPAFLAGSGEVKVRRVKDPHRWLTRRGSLPLLRAEASVLHAFAWADTDREAEVVLAAAVQQRLTAVQVLRDTLALMPELTRRGLVREVLDDVELGAHAGSELRFLRFLRAHRLPLPDQLQLRVRAGGTHYLDARYTLQRLTVELDGTHHRDVGTWEADALRSLRVVALLPGEQVVRITTGMLRNHAAEVAALLRSVLAGRVAA